MTIIVESSAAPVGTSIWRRFRNALKEIARNQSYRRECESLMRLDNHDLADIGLTRMDIQLAHPAPSSRGNR